MRISAALRSDRSRTPTTPPDWPVRLPAAPNGRTASSTARVRPPASASSASKTSSPFSSSASVSWAKEPGVTRFASFCPINNGADCWSMRQSGALTSVTTPSRQNSSPSNVASANWRRRSASCRDRSDRCWSNTAPARPMARISRLTAVIATANGAVGMAGSTAAAGPSCKVSSAVRDDPKIAAVRHRAPSQGRRPRIANKAAAAIVPLTSSAAAKMAGSQARTPSLRRVRIPSTCIAAVTMPVSNPAAAALLLVSCPST